MKAALENVAAVLAGPFLLMAGPILSAIGWLKG